MKKKNKWTSGSLEQTRQIAKQLAAYAWPGTTFCFFGELGAGKTTLIKSLIASLANISADEVTSPTFNYVNEYGENPKLYHFDLYRLQDPEEFHSMGFMEMVGGGAVTFIEWPEKIYTDLETSSLAVFLKPLDEQTREITLE